MTAAPIVFGMALISAPAFEQDAPADDEDVTSVNDASVDDTIVVTGSILRRTNTEAPSTVTVLSSETLQERGINTVDDAVQRLAANGPGTSTQGWNTAFIFASGANAPAMRGLRSEARRGGKEGVGTCRSRGCPDLKKK